MKILRRVLKTISSETKRVTGKEPVEAVGLKEVGVKKINYKRPVGHDEVRLPLDVDVRYLYAPGEYEGGDARRATDPIWSLGIFGLDRSVLFTDQPVLYYLSGDKTPSRSFVREELHVVPEDTELPPFFVLQ